VAVDGDHPVTMDGGHPVVAEVFVAVLQVECSSRGHPVAVDVLEDDVYWVTTTLGHTDSDHDAAVLTMNKFTRNVHQAKHDILTLLNDLRTELIIAHPALQLTGHTGALLESKIAV